MKTPLIIITRDRAEYAERCLRSFERFDEQLEIHIVDHGSTWPQMCKWLRSAGQDYGLHRRSHEAPHSLWAWPGLAEIVGDRCYLVTDPDVVLDSACPDDWLCRMSDQLRPGLMKVGLGLRIDDLPLTSLAKDVREWERAFWLDPAEGGAAWNAPVDTTLALYPSLHNCSPEFKLAPAVRLDAPYLLRHLPWYEEGSASEEVEYYWKHALPGTSQWSGGVSAWGV